MDKKQVGPDFRRDAYGLPPGGVIRVAPECRTIQNMWVMLTPVRTPCLPSQKARSANCSFVFKTLCLRKGKSRKPVQT